MSLEYAQGTGTSQSNNNDHSSHRLADITMSSNVSPPISSYKDIKNIPYTAEKLGYNDYLDVENNPTLAKVDPTFKSINAIDNYIIYMMRVNGLSDTAESYNEILEQLEESIGLSKNIDSKIRIAKLGTIVTLKMKREMTKPRYKIIQKQYGNKSSQSRRNNRYNLT